MAGEGEIASYIPSMSGISSASMLMVMYIVIPLVIWGLLLYWFTRKLKYKTLVIIRKKEGLSYNTLKDSGAIRVDRKTGISYFHLKKYRPLDNPRGRLKVPPAESFTTYRGRGILDIFFKNCIVLKDIDGVVKPIDDVNDDEKFISIDQETQQWAANDFKDTQQNYNKQSWWDKHGAMMVQIFSMVIIFVLFLILIQEMKDISAALSSIPGAMDRYTQAIGQLATSRVGVSP
jgi:hypothetical protein